MHFVKARGPPHKFYDSSLSYLVYTPIASIDRQEQYTLAVDISLSAIISESVFNFGEVVCYIHHIVLFSISWYYS